MSTIIQNDENYYEIKKILIELDLWNEELKELDEETKELAMAEKRDSN